MDNYNTKRSSLIAIDPEKDLDNLCEFLYQFSEHLGDLMAANKPFMNDKARAP